MIQAKQQILHAADGTALHVNDYMITKREAHKGSIVLMHGLGEHIGRYAHVVKFFNNCGLSVRGYDHRGHGKSEGKRGDVPIGDAILQDAQIVIEDFSSKFPEPPLLLGHSMGGLFAARFALAKMAPLSGLILSSPALSLPLSGGQKLLLKVLSKIAPGLGIPNGLAIDRLSHDPAIAKGYSGDPLVHPKISSRLLLRMLDAIQYCHSHASTLSIPCLIVVAGDDKLVDPEGSRKFFPNLPKRLGTMHIYEDFYHEIFNEVDAKRVFGDVRQWLVKENFIPS
jgi:alpha-beta hydrolase superfamily lysophospholipase